MPVKVESSPAAGRCSSHRRAIGGEGPEKAHGREGWTLVGRDNAMQADYFDPITETLDRESLRQLQLNKLQTMLSEVLKTNAFYLQKLADAGVERPEDVRTIEDYRQLPFTTKEELSADQQSHPPYGTNLTFPQQRYTRIHRTSGTTAQPLHWLDTPESWTWWGRCWAAVYKGAGVGAADRVFFAFSFGPFIGFWSGHEGARQIGALSIPGGGMSSLGRLEAIVAHQATVLVSTPTYALHLAEVAAEEGIDIADSSVCTTIHAGEPGASLPATKRRIETAWGARCYDHVGATEVGAWAFECQAQTGVHLNEGEFVCEVIDPETGAPADEGELIVTNLGRPGMPVIRYRTRDRVRLQTVPCRCGRTFRHLEGGVIGRMDDLLIVRGVNVYPTAVENIVRQFPEAGEFAVDVHRRHALDSMEIRLELSGDRPEGVCAAVGRAMRDALGLRVEVHSVPRGSLPRFELKARRFTD
ncbi:MAG: phenylacetate--CoA ligase family protein, partial [Planctomycetota bacterium]